LVRAGNGSSNLFSDSLDLLAGVGNGVGVGSGNGDGGGDVSSDGLDLLSGTGSGGVGSSDLFSDGSELLGIDRVLLFELLAGVSLHGLGESFPFIYPFHLLSVDQNEGIHFQQFSETKFNEKAIEIVMLLVKLLLHQDDVFDLTIHDVFIMLRNERNDEVEQHDQQNDLSKEPENINEVNVDGSKE